MDAPERARTWLMAQQPEMERVLAGLVQRNSHTAERANVTAVAEQLWDLFVMPGLDGERVAGNQAGTHLRFTTAAAGPRTLLVGHHDTVFPPGTFDGFREDGTLLRGPGVLDMKGGLVVVRFALFALAEAGLLGTTPLALVSVADEETGSHEGRAVIEGTLRDVQAALVFEAGRAGDAVITRRKGTGGITVTAHGRAAHAGNAHGDGVNAIWALARFVDGAQSLTDPSRGVTVSVGMMSGGTSRNTVPDRATCQLDFRFVQDADGRALVAGIHAAARAAEAAVPGARLVVEGGIARAPLERTDANVALMERYQVAAVRAGLARAESPLLGGGSDASTTAALGVASIDGLGPRGRGFHTLDEQVERATLVPRALALLEFLLASRLR
jgi:glutamate carboxypeptidase